MPTALLMGTPYRRGLGLPQLSVYSNFDRDSAKEVRNRVDIVDTTLLPLGGSIAAKPNPPEHLPLGSKPQSSEKRGLRWVRPNL